MHLIVIYIKRDRIILLKTYWQKPKFYLQFFVLVSILCLRLFGILLISLLGRYFPRLIKRNYSPIIYIKIKAAIFTEFSILEIQVQILICTHTYMHTHCICIHPMESILHFFWLLFVKSSFITLNFSTCINICSLFTF